VLKKAIITSLCCMPSEQAGLASDNGLARYYLAQGIPAYMLQVPTNLLLTVPDAS
jgi:hypothetical protein